MRKIFIETLYREMQSNEDIFFLCGGVGYGVVENILNTFPERAWDMEASEQAMVDIAVGLALEGKIPFVYSITPHLFRAFEGMRIYLDHHRIPVKLVGVGRDRDYDTLGFTHYGEGDEKILKTLGNIARYRPEHESNIPMMLEIMIKNKMPSYINLPR